MKKTQNKIFLAANSANGFVSYFTECYNPREEYSVYIIKGGPGTGKSSFMKYMAYCAEEKGLKVILCPCTSDPDSVDGVIIPKLKTVFLDGTAPHTVEPQYPAVCEQIINSGDFWNSDEIKKHKKEIISLSDKNNFYHKTANRYIAAAGQLFTDNLKLAARFTYNKKVAKFREKLILKYINGKGEKAERINCTLTGVTPKGIVSFNDTVLNNFKNIIIIEDRYGFAANEILRGISAAAILNGYKTVNVKNPLLPQEITDHILIPELSLAFVTENDFIKWDLPFRRIHARRFYDKDTARSLRGRMFFNRRIMRSLLLSAVSSLKNAKECHDSLEKYYVSGMDFNAFSKYTEKLAKKIF